MVDVSILGSFKPVFTFLLVFTIVYGLLEFSKVFGDKKNLNGMIAFVAGMIVMFSKPVMVMLDTMTPWFLVFVIFLFFTIFIVRMFGINDADLTKGFKTNSTLHVALIVIAIIIGVAGLSSAFGQRLLEKNTQAATLPVPTTTDSSGLPPVSDVASGNVQIAAGSSTATSNFNSNFLATIVHPKVLGMFFLLLIGVFALIFLTKSTAAGKP
jgi:hypothetical protein